jgi:hypothetical protein
MRRSAHPVLALQRLIGNRGTVQVLARDKNRPSFEHSVKVGKLGPVEIKGGNIGDSSGRTASSSSRSRTPASGATRRTSRARRSSGRRSTSTP